MQCQLCKIRTNCYESFLILLTRLINVNYVMSNAETLFLATALCAEFVDLKVLPCFPSLSSPHQVS